MPAKGYRKPGSVRDKKAVQSRQEEFLKGIDDIFDAIIEKSKAGKPLTDEEIRFAKKYNETRSTVTSKDDIEVAPGLSPGKLKSDIEKLWKLTEIP